MVKTKRRKHRKLKKRIKSRKRHKSRKQHKLKKRSKSRKHLKTRRRRKLKYRGGGKKDVNGVERQKKKIMDLHGFLRPDIGAVTGEKEGENNFVEQREKTHHGLITFDPAGRRVSSRRLKRAEKSRSEHAKRGYHPHPKKRGFLPRTNSTSPVQSGVVPPDEGQYSADPKKKSWQRFNPFRSNPPSLPPSLEDKMRVWPMAPTEKENKERLKKIRALRKSNSMTASEEAR
jgi:hypothetical protein